MYSFLRKIRLALHDGRSGWKGGVDSAFLPLTFVFGLTGVDRSQFNWFFPYLNRGEVQCLPRLDPRLMNSDLAKLRTLPGCYMKELHNLFT